MKFSFSAVVEYVKDLMPVFGSMPITSDSPFADADVLAHISGGCVFYVTASNGRTYLYVFPRGEENMDLAKYILRSNGLRPRLHLSDYYYDKSPVLRVPCAEFCNCPQKKSFVDSLLKVSSVNIEKEKVEARKKLLQIKMLQQNR